MRELRVSSRDISEQGMNALAPTALSPPLTTATPSEDIARLLIGD